MVEISVVVPAYNAVDYLDEAITSIIDQSFKDLEIICVDDGSTDDTLERLEEYASRDSRIQVFHQENQGPGGATNTGISKASGKYIYLMDADDALDLNALEELHNIMEERDLDFVIFKAINYDQDTDSYYEIDYYTMPKLYECVGDSVFNWRDLGSKIFKISVTPWSKLYRHEFVKESGAKFPMNLIYQDNIFFYQILFSADRIYFYDKFLYKRRVHSKSLVNSHNEKSVQAIEIFNLIVKTFMDYGHFEEFKSELYNRKINTCNYRYNLIRDEFKELFFVEMKKDFEKIIGHEKYDDFYSNLYLRSKMLFDNVILSNNHVEYDLRNELSSIKKDNAKLKKDIKLLKSNNGKLKNENKKLNKEVKDLSKFKKSVLSSKSWKLTKPFRAFMNFFRK